MARRVNPDQFKLFMTGTEWQSSVNDSADRRVVEMGREAMPDLWERKESEARLPGTSLEHGSGVYDAIKQEGYDHGAASYPGDVPTVFVNRQGKQTQGEGHHRIAAAAALERETGKSTFIPTNYRGTYEPTPPSTRGRPPL